MGWQLKLMITHPQIITYTQGDRVRQKMIQASVNENSWKLNRRHELKLCDRPMPHMNVHVGLSIVVHQHWPPKWKCYNRPCT